LTHAAEILVALITEGIRHAVAAGCLVALVTDDPVFALEAELPTALVTVESVFTLRTECLLAHFAPIELSAVEAKSLVALSAEIHF
jgi:hypothetical protein